ncbi:hypothetical protein VPH35_110388 [Triticum aestivum]|uniref:Protein FAR1-RELATED SEQUENCE n=1 Tax=Triticum turgidum subsp. durum TaxID=4567 RepID=A0A9R1B9J4_TRITD|nr:unnamed protein product [Triticum turgidum subsp. durum]
MLDLRVSEIPTKHIMKRWTKDSRDILPENLLMYQNDRGGVKNDTYRHAKLYHTALEFVRRGAANVQAYETALILLEQANNRIQAICAIRDGMGVADREAAALAEATESSCMAQDGGRNETSGMSLAPKRKRPTGSPTTSRDKAPYEKAIKRSRFCKICRVEGHKNTTCPQCGDMPKAPRKEPKCTNCGVLGPAGPSTQQLW